MLQLDERIVPTVALSSGITGLNNTGWYPPDTNLAVSSTYVVETVNETYAIYNKSTGALVSSQALTSLFSGLDTNGGPFDPSVMYDEGAGRFVIEAAIDDSGASKSYVDLAFSKSSDPTQGWTTTQVETDQGGLYWADNGKIGYNNDAYVYTGNLYTFSGSYSQEVIVSADKSTVGGTLKDYVVTQSGDFSMIPARMHTSAAGAPMWFVESTWNGGSTLTVTKMTNILSTNPTFTSNSVSVNSYSEITSVTQPGGTVSIVDCRTLNVEWNNNYLVASLNSKSGSDAAAAWYQLSTSGTNPTLSQQGVIHPGTGIATYFPAVTVDSSGDLAMTYMESSSTEYVSMYVTGRMASDSANTMEAAVLAKAGTVTLSPNTAGDYSGIAIDPSAANTFWGANEYAPSGVQWGAYFAQFTVTSGSGTNTAPTITTAASASPSTVTGKTTNLSVSATDGDGDALTYTWSVTSQPSGSTIPSFSANGSSSSNNTTATFYQYGSYTFLVTVTDSAALSVTSSVTVTVNQTQTSVSVSPTTATLANNALQQFTATALDQFGKSMATQPSFTWSIAAGGVGTISVLGLYTAPLTGTGSATVTATTGSLSASATVTITSIPAAPTSLTATAISATEVDLSWTETSTNATGFYVQRSSNSGKSWTQIATVTPGSARTYADKTTSKLKTYLYRVDAYNSGGTSAWSNTATAKTPSHTPYLSPGRFPPTEEPGGGTIPNPLSDFVTGLYRDVLNRLPDQAGLSGWVSALQSGISRLQVAQWIWESPEHRGLEVDSYYQTYLKRDADPAGRAGWIQGFENGLNETQIQFYFVTTPEYQLTHASAAAYITALYNDVLGRQPDAAGLASWEQVALLPGWRNLIAQGILGSTEEYVRIVDGFYTTFLGRQADAAGQQGWVASLQQNLLSPGQVAEYLLGSPEYFAWFTA